MEKQTEQTNTGTLTYRKITDTDISKNQDNRSGGARILRR